MKLQLLSYDKFLELGRDKLGVKPKQITKPIEYIFSREVFKQIPITVTDSKHGWDGSKGSLHIASRIDVMSQLHEAFHYFMCEPDRLQYDDFGLGSGAISYGLDDACLTTDINSAELEEQSVCILTLCAAKCLGIPKSAILMEMQYAQMEEVDREEYEECIDMIRERNLKQFGFELKYPLLKRRNFVV
jgi:hypothetical protein